MSRPKKLKIVKDDHDHSHEGHGQDLPIPDSVVAMILNMTEENQGLRANYERLLTQVGRALMKSLELRDPYTYGHSMRVMEYTLMIGRGAQGAPWRLAEIAHALHGTPAPTIPQGTDLAALIIAHYQDMLSFYGTELGLRCARKHLGWALDVAARAAAAPPGVGAQEAGSGPCRRCACVTGSGRCWRRCRSPVPTSRGCWGTTAARSASSRWRTCSKS